MAYEQKPNTFSLFKDTDDRIAERKQFYREKGWDENAVPTYSGKLLLEGGTELGIEARIIEGAKGKFFAGRVWQKKGSIAQQSSQTTKANDPDLDDDVPF